MSNTAYFDGLTQNEMDCCCRKVGATLEEYKELAEAQGDEFTEEEKKSVDDSAARIQARFDKIGFEYPIGKEIVFVKSKMQDELGAADYTHSNQIYLLGFILHTPKQYRDELDCITAFELFCVLSRNNKAFRQSIYKVSGFTIIDEPDDFQ